MHASIACLLLYEDYVWVSLGNAMKAKQAKQAKQSTAKHSKATFHFSTGACYENASGVSRTVQSRSKSVANVTVFFHFHSELGAQQ
jgi:hypothetical protein